MTDPSVLSDFIRSVTLSDDTGMILNIKDNDVFFSICHHLKIEDFNFPMTEDEMMSILADIPTYVFSAYLLYLTKNNEFETITKLFCGRKNTEITPCPVTPSNKLDIFTNINAKKTSLCILDEVTFDYDICIVLPNPSSSEYSDVDLLTEYQNYLKTHSINDSSYFSKYKKYVYESNIFDKYNDLQIRDTYVNGFRGEHRILPGGINETGVCLLLELAAVSRASRILKEDLHVNFTPRQNFLELFRNVIVTKLSHHLHLTTDLVESSDGEYIYLLIAADEGDLTRHARRTEYPVQIDMSIADPEGYEPCDEYYRPLIELFYRLNVVEVIDSFEKFIHEYLLNNNVNHLYNFYSNRLVYYQSLRGVTGCQMSSKQNQQCNISKVHIENNNLPYSNVNDFIRSLVTDFIDIPYRRKGISHKISTAACSVNDSLVNFNVEEMAPLFLKYMELRQQGYTSVASCEICKLYYPMRVLLGQKYHVKKEGETSIIPIDVPKPLVIFNEVPFDDEILTTNTIREYHGHSLSGASIKSVFSSVDRINILFEIIQSQIDIFYLKNKGIIIDAFPIKDDQLRLYSNFQFADFVLGTDLSKLPLVPYLSKYNGDSAIELKFLHGGHVTNFAKSLPDDVVEKEDLQVYLKDNKSAKWELFTAVIREIFKDKMEYIYYGKKICLYFTFLRHYTKWTLFPCGFGILFAILHASTKNSDDIVYFLNSIFIIIYSTLWYEYWSVHEIKTSLSLWGQTPCIRGGSSYFRLASIERSNIPNYEEQIRLSFDGVLRRSPVTGVEGEVYFSGYSAFWRFTISILISALFVLAVLVSVVLISSLQNVFFEFTTIGSYNYSQNLVGLINGAQILIFNEIYNRVAVLLTRYENHRYNSDFRTSYILKSFLFKIVNSYSSLIYIAFLKRPVANYTDSQLLCVGASDASTNDTSNVYEDHMTTTESPEKTDAECVMNLLNNQLLSLLIVNSLKNVVEIALPFLKAKYKLYRKKQYAKQKISHSDDGHVPPNSKLISSIDKQVVTESYGSFDLLFDGTIEDFLEIVILFGFFSWFSITLPIGGLLLFLNSFLEIFVDTYKLRSVFRRPFPQESSNIGIWNSLFEIVIGLSIVWNSAILAFTAEINFGFDFIREWYDADIGVGYKTQLLISFVTYLVFLYIIRLSCIYIIFPLTGVIEKDASLIVLSQVRDRMKYLHRLLKYPPKISEEDIGEKIAFNVQNAHDFKDIGRWRG